jgi:hypothetical protein
MNFEEGRKEGQFIKLNNAEMAHYAFSMVSFQVRNPKVMCLL